MCNRVSFILAPILFIVVIANCQAAPVKDVKDLARRRFISIDFNRIVNRIERYTLNYIHQIADKSTNLQAFFDHWSNTYPIEFSWNFNEQPGITTEQYTKLVEDLHDKFSQILNQLTIAENTIAHQIHGNSVIIKKELDKALDRMEAFLDIKSITIHREQAAEKTATWKEIECGLHYVYLTKAMRRFQEITKMFVES